MDVLSFLIFIDGYVGSLNHVLINNLLALILVVLAYDNKEDSNFLFVISMMLIPKLVDILVLNDFLLSDFVPNYLFFLFYSVYDALVLWLILYRTKVIRLFLIIKIKVCHLLNINSDAETFTYVRHVNEYKITVIFAVSILINLIVAVEYPLRWYISDEILYFYYLYAPLKFGLNIALVYWGSKMNPEKQNTSRSTPGECK